MLYCQVQAAVLALLGCGVAALPSFSFSSSSSSLPLSSRDSSSLPNLGDDSLAPRGTKPFYLRIAPLGASITRGYLSSDGNGFRKPLRDQLRYEGWPVNMVGSLQTGSMKDNDHEGHLGWTIQEVTSDALPNIVSSQPNLVLINVGTNNAIQNNGVDTADIPGATVILSTVLCNKNSATNSRALTMNAAIRDTVVPHYSNQNKPLVVANMTDGFITQADLNDDTHPTDAGYKKMAAVWWDAFQKADAANYLTAPPDTGTADNATSSETRYTCDKTYGDGDGNYQIQRGSGTDDGIYVHSSDDMGIVWTNPRTTAKSDSDNLERLFFAQLVNKNGADRGGEADDIIFAEHTKKGGWSWSVAVNNNSVSFDAYVSIDPGMQCAPNATRFGDLNNDGLDDFICISASSGNLEAALNLGGSPPKFNYTGVIGVGPDFWVTESYDVARAHIADIDGDGRADWCIVLLSGNVTCHRNGGSGDLPIPEYGGFWQDFESGSDGWTTVFPSKYEDGAGGVNLLDINGDFKADWLFMNDTGAVETYINTRGEGTSIIPDWRSAGVTHSGLASFGVENANEAVKFGRIYGSGRRDYIWVEEVENPRNARQTNLKIRVWKNTGEGGTRLKGDGSNYCDMNGDGEDDYIWVGPNGEIDVYLNINNRPYWNNHMGVFTMDVKRKTIHIADLDGDGKCDLLSVDKASGAVTMWQNKYNGTSNKFAFTALGVVSGSANCTQGYGVSETDLGVRFADITGNGKADYLCIEPDGLITGFVNSGSAGEVSFTDVGQIKSAGGYDRANLRFSDVDGDGLTDVLWLDKYTGDATVWLNDGQKPTSGSAFSWLSKGILYKGWDRGANMHFSALSGQHRADMVQVIPQTNLAYVSYNKCASSGGGGGDDADMGDPDLPAYTAS